MGKAGGIISLVAGIFALIAAGMTLVVGGFGRAVNADNATTVVLLGWGGVLFSFAVIVLGAMAINRPTRALGTWLIVCSILGAFLGGTFVAILMLLSLVAGIIVLMGAGSEVSPGTATAGALPQAARLVSEKIDGLARLSAQKADGLISMEQFNTGKSKILGRGVRAADTATSPSSAATTKSAAMAIGDLPRIQKLRAEGMLSDSEFGKLALGIVQRSERELTLDHLPLLAELKSLGAMPTDEYDKIRAAIVERQI